MGKMEDFLDDNVIIPDDIKNMTREQLEEEIIKFEKELQNNKQ